MNPTLKRLEEIEANGSPGYEPYLNSTDAEAFYHAEECVEWKPCRRKHEDDHPGIFCEVLCDDCGRPKEAHKAKLPEEGGVCGSNCPGCPACPRGDR